MRFSLFVTDAASNQKVHVTMSRAKVQDLRKTTMPPEWSTNWMSDFIRNSGYSLYALKTEDGELVALGAYEVCINTVSVHIVYMESQAESNPTLNPNRKYRNIGRALIAFGIKLSVDAGFNGDVTLDAKTPELAAHYMTAYGAVSIPSRHSSAAPRYLICDAAAQEIFTLYLEV